MAARSRARPSAQRLRRFGIVGETQAVQVGSRLLTNRAAWEHDPVTIARLRRLRGLKDEAGSMKSVGGVVAIAAWLVALTACGVVPQTAATSTTAKAPLLVATSTCSSTPDAVLSEDGKSVTLDTQGEDDIEGEDVADVQCFLRGLGAPDYVAQHISTTRALDGQQTDEWDDIEARWTYHPDNGLQITFIDRS